MLKKYPVIGLYTNPKVLAVFFLGISSGLPLSLVLSTLSVWLAEEGVSKTAIGLFAAITTPYALKFMWSPLVDKLPLPFFTKLLGRRRGWMVFTQACLALSLIALGMSNPAENAWITALCAFIVAVSSASQDIVIDAYRVEILEEKLKLSDGSVVAVSKKIVCFPFFRPPDYLSIVVARRITLRQEFVSKDRNQGNPPALAS